MATSNLYNVDVGLAQLVKGYRARALAQIDTPGPPPPVFLTFNNLSSTANSIVLTFSDNVTLTGPAASYSNWTISSNTGNNVRITNVSVQNKSITLTTTEQTNGANYILNIPSYGINGSNSIAYSGPYSHSFTGTGTASVSVSSSVIDADTIQIVFSGPITVSDALIVTNYSINNGVTISNVQKVNEQTFNLTTSRLHSSTTYTITISNIRDAAGNYI